MNGVITKISLSAERAEDEPIDYQDLNSDVIVRLDNGDEYVATFFSLKNLRGMMDEYMNSGDQYSGTYYKILNAVLVHDLSNKSLFPVIENMIIEGDFQVVFKKV